MSACEALRMRTIALINQKGGCGKTTVALHLAAAFWQRGENVLVLDLDPQASAAEWHEARTEPLPHVESVQPARLAKVVAHAREIATGVLVLDTAPFGSRRSRCISLRGRGPSPLPAEHYGPASDAENG